MMERQEVFEGERIDETGFGDLKLIQKPELFCYGVDSVLLADFAASGRNGEKITVADLGTGSGVIPLIISHKIADSLITGIEFQPQMAEMAVRTMKLNGLSDRISILRADVKDVREWGKNMKGRFDMVVANPPYFPRGSAIVNPLDAKAAARHETTADLEDFMRCAAWMLRDRGDFYMVHRPSRLADICCFGRKTGLEPKEMMFVSPTAGGIPNILLVHLVAGGGRELKILPPLAVYERDGSYTAALLAAYERVR